MADTLNQAQRQAVDWSGGPLIVLAGPGTGKTRVIAHRVERMLGEGHDPASIVAVTYTVKAAAQLRDRVATLTTFDKADRLNIHTFHGLGMRLLRRFGDVLGLPAEPDLIDSAQTKRLLRELVSEHRIFTEAVASGRDAAIERAVRVMNTLQDHAVDPAEAITRGEAWLARARGLGEEGKAEVALAEEFREQARLYDAFDRARRRRGWLSFGDLITLPVRLLQKGGRAAAICRGEFKHFIVDEFQDSNPAQLEMLRLLAPSKKADVCVVGDDDQSIYAFRGADDRAFEAFLKAWRAAKEIRLVENYRSAPEIVAAGNRIMSLAEHRFAPDKQIVAAGERRAGVVEAVKLEEDDQDAAAIAAMFLSERAADPSLNFGRFAVLARNHSDLDRAAAAMELEGIPVRRQRSRSPIDDAGVQDVLAWATFLARPDETWAARRVLLRPPYGLDPVDVTTWEKLYRVRVRQHGLKLGFAAWLEAERGDSETLATGVADERVAKFIARHAELRAVAGATPADETIFQIITRIDAGHADLPAEAGGHARSRRVADLVTLARFARARQKRLAPPGDLAAFLEYYDDLDENERKLGGLGDERLDASVDAGDPQAPPNAVNLLTAHSAKGLEFDTVFVMRVQPRNGFGKAARDDGVDLPPEVLGRAVSNESGAGEQRRLFYVACTRAERRLVLLAKNNKTKSKSRHFFEEFTRDPEGLKLVTAREGREVFEEAARRGVMLKGGAGVDVEGARGLDFRSVLARARSRARQAATVALEAADRADLSGEGLDEVVARLREAAGRLAIAAAAERGQVPGWAAGREAWAREAAALAEGKAASLAPKFEFVRPGPRLDLSYTSIKDYQRCPRCWYVKYMMQVPERGTAELNLGVIVHGALEAFIDRRRHAEADGMLAPGLDALDQLCEEHARRAAGPLRVVEAHELEAAQVLARRAVAMLDAEPANVLEVEREVRFGYARGDERHTMSAKIDRIDQMGDGRLRIVDYKTGNARKALTAPAEDDLQLGLYAMAAASLYGEATGVAEYWVLTTGERGRVELGALDMPAIRGAIDEVIDGLVGGRFEKGKDCTGSCDILGEIAG